MLKESNAILLSKSEEMVPFGMVKVGYSLYWTLKAKKIDKAKGLALFTISYHVSVAELGTIIGWSYCFRIEHNRWRMESTDAQYLGLSVRPSILEAF